MTSCSSNSTKAPQFGIAPIDDVIAAMTLDEKANFVLGVERMKATPPPAAPGMPERPMFTPEFQAQLEACETEEERQLLFIATSTNTDKVAGAAGQHYAIPRLGIAPIVYADGPAGLRIDPTRKDDENEYYCTAFPVGATLAASWDTELVGEVTKAMGEEVKEYGVDVLLAPAINIHRSPLCGRNFEYYSEDPMLAGKIASAYINGIQSNGVGVSLKHFAVNSQETFRNGVDAQLSQRALREIYLKGFEIAVKESQPWTIMSSYNKVNGTLASENKQLLTDILRGEWGFEGFVMTDWWAEMDGARQIAAGNDLLMPGTQHQYDEIVAGIQNGTLKEEELDLAIKNIMNVMLKTPTYKHYNYSNKPDLDAHAKVTRQAATDGMVLLKNAANAKGTTLPLQAKTVALFGTASYDLLVGGSGSGNVNRKYKVSLNEGLENNGMKLEQSINKTYTDYIKSEKDKMPKENFWAVPVVAEMPLQAAQVRKAIASADVAVITISRMAGEGGDRLVEKGDYLLSDVEAQNLRLVCAEAHAAGKKAVLVLNMGSSVDLTKEVLLPDAILHAWMGGQEMGNSLADVLMGKVNPSGKLPFTWAKNYTDYSSSNNFPNSDGNDAIVRYEEDVMVGYRHFDTKGIEPLFPFGFGLSYTTFAYSDMAAEVVDGGVQITLNVKNTGERAGREVVQIYVAQPKIEGLLQPAKELKAFCKTATIEPGATSKVTIKVSKEDLASFFEEKNAWVVTPGTYNFIAAASATDIRLCQEVTIK